MMGNWEKTTLEDVCVKITDGAHHSPKSVEYGLPMGSVKDLTPYGINLETCRHISLEDFENLVHQGCQPQIGDVLIAKDGNSALETVCQIKQKLNVVLLSSVAILRPNINKINSSYLRYFLDCKTTREYLKNGFITGAAIPRVVLKDFKRCEISLPPLPTQKKIAGILSAYDDLIENNTRRIKILEEMAQTLYYEWFVKLRFPGHEHTKMVDSELRLIPEGWKVVTIRDVSVYINRGIAPKYDEQSESIVINQKCIRDNKINLALARRHSKKVPEEKLIQFGDILINSTGIGTLGRVAQVYQKISDCTVDSHVSIVRPADCVNIDYFGFALIQLQPYFDHMGVGSTGQTELSRQSIGDTNFLLPPKNLQETFSQAVSPMRHAMIGMFAKNSNLRQTRDLLLPKLISGEIDVKHLEITTEDIAA